MGMGLRGVSALAVGGLALTLAGCDLGSGSSSESRPPPISPGTLAEYVPRNADLYFEAALRPQPERQEELDAALEALGGGDDELSGVREEFLRNIAEQLPLDDVEPLDYAEDIQPWLGERVAAFAIVSDNPETLAQTSDPPDEAIEGAVIMAVEDLGAARETVERLANPSWIIGRAGTKLYVEGIATTAPRGLQDVALVKDAMIVGDPDAIGAALSAARRGSLAQTHSFRSSLDSVEPHAAAWFAGRTGALARINLIRSGPRFAARHGDELIEQLPYDPDEPFVMQAAPVDDGIALDTSYALRGPSPLDAAERQVGELSDEAFVAFADPVVIPALIREAALGVEIGLEGRRSFDPITKLGYDPVAALEMLHPPAAAFALDSPGSGLIVGIKVRAEDAEGLTRPPDAARFLLAASGVASIKPLNGDEYEFVAKMPGLLGAIEVRQDGSELTLAMGGDHAARKTALRPTKTLADSGALEEVADAVGENFSPLGFLELGPAIDALQEVPGLVPPITTVPDVVEQSRLDLGGRTDGNLFVLRYVLHR